MRAVRLLIPLLAALMLAAPPASAAEAECGAGNPPCGWINPYMDLILPDKLPCGSLYQLSEELDPASCMAPPTFDEPVVLTGDFRMFWEICDEGTYLNDPNDPIVVSFGGNNRNPEFIGFDIEPDTFTFGTEDLFNPQNWVVEQSPGGDVTCWFDYREPITVTFTRVSDPTERDIEILQNTPQCVFTFNVKMESDTSGEQFKEGWAIEPFRFHMSNDPLGPKLCDGQKSTPSIGAPVIIGGLALLAVALRRN